MDKELLRIVIIATGLLIIVGMLVWGYLNSQRDGSSGDSLREIREKMRAKLVARDKGLEEPEIETYSDSPQFGEYDDDDDGYEPNKKYAAELNHGEKAGSSSNKNYLQPTVEDKAVLRQQLPRLIQLSIVAKTEHGFGGVDLDTVFNMVGLEYANSVKIYERLDMERRVDYCVASMVNPGTFPETDLEAFYTPGVTFYMQPQELPDPILVFDDLVRTINLLVHELDGIVWDATRKPLTEATLKSLRKSLQVG